VVNWIHGPHRILETPLALALGEFVRLLRQSRRWSREELAAHANISSQTVRNIEEQFVMWPQAATIGGLARAFEISVNQLMHPEEEGEAEDWRSHLAKLEQQKLGARWVEGDGRFAIDPTGAESDVDAANQPIVQQLHPPIIQKASLFNDISKRLDNALGWHGIAAASQRFLDGVDRATRDIPNHLGSIYSANWNLDRSSNKI
jgi:transcriptional regulator with XRE-family HTH domain